VNPGDVFTVTNHQIRISGDGMGYLVTREAFRDFHLSVAWRWGRTNTFPERSGKPATPASSSMSLDPTAIPTMAPARSGRVGSAI
jgi:hypothetical protein